MFSITDLKKIIVISVIITGFQITHVHAMQYHKYTAPDGSSITFKGPTPYREGYKDTATLDTQTGRIRASSYDDRSVMGVMTSSWEYEPSQAPTVYYRLKQNYEEQEKAKANQPQDDYEDLYG